MLASSCGRAGPDVTNQQRSLGTPTIADPTRGTKPLARSEDILPSSCQRPLYVAIPEDQDIVLQEYRRRQKYVLVIGASLYKNKEYDRLFVEESAKAVRDALVAKGYKELGYLVGRAATKENVRKALEKVQDLSENFTVLIYYSGHAVVSDGDQRDLYLQCADEEVGEFRGIPVSQVLTIARSNKIFKGRIILLIDSCYSSQTLLSPTIWSNVANKDTIIISSSSSKQQSWPFKPRARPTMTAFGYFFVEALTTDWACADTLPDGGMTVDELVYHTRRRLNDAYKQRAIEGEMEPDYSDPLHRTVIAYDNTKIAEVASPLRNELVALSLTDESIKKLAGAVGQSGSVVVKEDGAVVASVDLSSLAKKVADSPNDAAADLFVRLSSENAQHLTLEVVTTTGKKIDAAQLDLTRSARIASEIKKDQGLQIDKFASSPGRYLGITTAETSTVMKSKQ